MHVAADVAGPLPKVRYAMGTLYIFISQPIGILIEDLAQDLYRRQRRGKQIPGEHDESNGGELSKTLETVLIQTMGYIWTGMFLVSTTPLWVHPVARVMRRQDAVLQQSAFAPLIAWFQGQ